MKRNLIWVDTASGTWGEVDGDVGRLMIVDLDKVAEHDREAGLDTGHDAASVMAWLEDRQDDSSVVEFANLHGSIAAPSDDSTDDDGECHCFDPLPPVKGSPQRYGWDGRKIYGGTWGNPFGV